MGQQSYMPVPFVVSGINKSLYAREVYPVQEKHTFTSFPQKNKKTITDVTL